MKSLCLRHIYTYFAVYSNNLTIFVHIHHNYFGFSISMWHHHYSQTVSGFFSINLSSFFFSASDSSIQSFTSCWYTSSQCLLLVSLSLYWRKVVLCKAGWSFFVLLLWFFGIKVHIPHLNKISPRSTPCLQWRDNTTNLYGFLPNTAHSYHELRALEISSMVYRLGRSFYPLDIL